MPDDEDEVITYADLHGLVRKRIAQQAEADLALATRFSRLSDDLRAVCGENNSISAELDRNAIELQQRALESTQRELELSLEGQELGLKPPTFN